MQPPPPAPAASPDLSSLFAMMADMQTQMLQLAAAREPRSSIDDARAKLFKFGTPDKFDGSKKEKVRGFLDQCDREFQVKPGVYNTDRLKILYAESYMEGPAQSWAREYSAGRVLATWEQFEQLLIATFGGGSNIAGTERDFVHLKQGTKSIGTYITEFNELSTLLPSFNDYARRALFRANLNTNYQSIIVPMVGQDNMTLAEFQMECRRYEDQADAKRHTTSGNNYHSSGRGYSAPRAPVVNNTTVAIPPVPATSAHTGAGVPMEVDAARMPRRDPCYRCWQPGHVAVNCPNQRRDPPPEWKGRGGNRMNASGARLQTPDSTPEGGWASELARQNGDEPPFWTPSD